MKKKIIEKAVNLGERRYNSMPYAEFKDSCELAVQQALQWLFEEIESKAKVGHTTPIIMVVYLKDIIEIKKQEMIK